MNPGPSPQPPSYRNLQIARLRDAGLTYREIGERFGISGPRARQIYNDTNRRLREMAA